MVCERIDEVPTSLLKQTVEKSADSTTLISIQLFSDNAPSDFEFSSYIITNSIDSVKSGVFNENGLVELEIQEGVYSFQLKNLDSPDFELDSINIEQNSQTRFEIKLGTQSGFMTVSVKIKRRRFRH